MTWYSRLRKMTQQFFGPPEPAVPPAAAAAPLPARGSGEDVSTVDDPVTPALTFVAGTLKLRVGVVSVVGNYRDHNEDNFYVPGRRPVKADGPPEASGEMSTSELDPENVLIVADGMGGQQAGEQASLMAVEIIPKAFARRLPLEPADVKATQSAIREAVAEANQEILGCSGASSDFANMGTTVVLAVFLHDRAYIAGIGDSRAYRLRAGRLEQLTEDHSLADALAKAGTITKEELQNHKYKNVLYNYLGCKDARQGPDEVKVLDARPGDRFLLASDGLTGVVSDEDLARALGTCDDPQKTARILKDLALSNDSKDNVTALVIHVVNDPLEPSKGFGNAAT